MYDDTEDRRMYLGENEVMYILRIGGVPGQAPNGSPYAGDYNPANEYDDRIAARGGNSLPTAESFLREFVHMVEAREKLKNKNGKA